MLLDVLCDIADRWEEVARFLNVRPGSIAVVRSQNTDARNKLFEIMKRWLNETHPQPTVKDLVDALRRPFISEHRIADAIEKKFDHGM